MPKDLSGAQTGMSPSNSINSPRPNNIRGRNVFPQTFKHLTTDRYGEYSPFYWAKAERGDVQNLKSDHDLHTYTMKTPMVSDVTMTKSFIKVPMQAIYPVNWEKMFTIPTQGDDVPFSNKALLNVSALVDALIIRLRNDTSDTSFKDFIYSLLLLESIVSHGSLFERFNYHFNYLFSGQYDPTNDGTDYVEFSNLSIDSILDLYVFPSLLNIIENDNLALVKDGITYRLNTQNTSFQSATIKYVSPRRFIELLRSQSFEFTDDWDNVATPALLLKKTSGYSVSDNDSLINIEPIIAYQLSCAQFGSNEFVDFIWSADLYRQNMLSLFLTAENSNSIPTFRYNGVRTLYDLFTSQIFDSLTEKIEDTTLASSPYAYSAMSFFLNLFSYQKSLRFGDYFTGGKPRPLAVGEYSAEVNNNSVSAIDITKSIQMQRLLNRVNMVGRKLGDYLAGIFGGKLPEAPKDVPIFLAHQKFSIKGFETENTGDIQFNPEAENTITSHLRASDNRHSFEIEIDEPCYLIGMNSYESLRVYSRTLDRFAFHHDRYDDFIPEQQYIGDQDIRTVELDSSSNDHTPFAYCLRYMEYKQRYSYASGGFIENLPSWAFITDNSDGNPSEGFIDPDYIRSSPSEFDRFYKVLNGYSLGGYFHFIVVHTNVTAPVRMMEYTPEILK